MLFRSSFPSMFMSKPSPLSWPSGTTTAAVPQAKTSVTATAHKPMPEINQDAAAIDVHDLSKRFGRKLVVDRVSLRVEQGEIYSFLSPNGSGKTTCIRLMCGLLTPDSGSGTCLGFDILRESAAIKRRVGYMTQKFSF